MAKSKIKSTRITKALAHSIQNRALSWKFDKEWEKIEKKGLELSLEIYKTLVTPEVLAMLKKLPPSCTQWECEIPNYRVFREDIDPDFNEENGYIISGLGLPLEFPAVNGEDDYKLFPSGFNLDSDTVEWLKSHDNKLYGKLKRFSAKVNAYYIRYKRFNEEIDKILESVNTTKKLLDVLPIAEKWIPEVNQCSDMPTADNAAAIINI